MSNNNKSALINHVCAKADIYFILFVAYTFNTHKSTNDIHSYIETCSTYMIQAHRQRDRQTHPHENTRMCMHMHVHIKMHTHT